MCPHIGLSDIGEKAFVFVTFFGSIRFAPQGEHIRSTDNPSAIEPNSEYVYKCSKGNLVSRLKPIVHWPKLVQISIGSVG